MYSNIYRLYSLTVVLFMPRLANKIVDEHSTDIPLSTIFSYTYSFLQRSVVLRHANLEIVFIVFGYR